MELYTIIIITLVSNCNGQIWYTASIRENNPIAVFQDHTISNAETDAEQLTPHDMTETTTALPRTTYSTNTEEEHLAVAPRPFWTEYFTKAPVKENIASNNLTYHKRLQEVLWFNNTINNINLVKNVRPKRRIVRKCPSVQTRHKFKAKSKFLDVFHVVEFDHVGCTSGTGLDGICLHQYECETSGGIPMDDCADGYGKCCVRQYSCGDVSSSQASWFTNPGFPSPSTERLSCAITLEKASEDIAQIRLDLINFELLPPSSGVCEEDQFMITGQNINNFIPILCGVNNGQHLYIEVSNVVGPIYLSIQTIAEENRLFAIKISQLAPGDVMAAPTGCLQYYRDRQGILESFNYQDTSTLVLSRIPGYMNNLNYAMCIERTPDSCSVTYSNAGDMEIYNYDSDGLPLIPMGQAGIEIFNCPDDWLLISAARLCGDRLNDGTVFQDFSLDAPVTGRLIGGFVFNVCVTGGQLCNYEKIFRENISAGPIVVWFRSDGSYASRGFRIEYLQNPCSSPI